MSLQTNSGSLPETDAARGKGHDMPVGQKYVFATMTHDLIAAQGLQLI